MKLDYKDGKIHHNLYDAIDWSKDINFMTEGFVSEDMLQVEYDNCLIDLGWYGGAGDDGGFQIMVIIHRFNDEDQNDPNYQGGKYSAQDWAYPYAKIPCKDQHDMFIQLQRAIDIYPNQTKNIK